MIKFTRILLICSLIIVVIIVAIQLYLLFNQNTQVTRQNSNQIPSDHATRQEVLVQYFQSLQLENNVLKSGDKIVANWQLQNKIADDPSFLVRIVDAQKNIFISETQPLALKNYRGSSFTAPKSAGQYELWFYIIENNTESLVSILPFEVK